MPSFTPRPASARPRTAAPMGLSGKYVRVYPSEIVIPDLEVGVSHLVTIVTVNIDQRPRRIHFKPPSKPEFKLYSVPTGPVAAGLEVHAELEFLPKEDMETVDEVVVVCESDTLRIPVRCTPSRPDLSVTQPMVSFGVVQAGRTAIGGTTFINTGHRMGKFSLPASAGPFSISPHEGTLAAADMPGAAVQIKVEALNREVGQAREIVPIMIDGADSGARLDLSASFVKQSLTLLRMDGGGELEAAPFGTILYGQKRTMEVLLANTGPDQTEWSVENAQSSGEPGDESSLLPFVFEPRSGLLDGFGKVPVRITFVPQRSDKITGWAHQEAANTDIVKSFQVSTVFECSAAPDGRFKLLCEGQASLHALSAEPLELNFGDCLTKENRDIMVTVKNNHPDLPVDFKIPRIPHFRARPATGRLRPLQSMPVIVTFCPAQMGEQSTHLPITIGGNVASINLFVNGVCSGEGMPKTMTGGPTATVKDFEHKPVYVDPNSDAIKGKDREPFSRPPLWQKHDPALSTAPAQHTLSAGEIKTRLQHKSSYNKFIRTNKAVPPSMSAGKDISSFELGVDMGMAPYGGMQSPRPSLPVANEPLYFNPNAGKQVLKPKTIALDEDRAIVHKFKAAPSTPAEQKACSSSLKSEELLNIGTNPRKMEFGRVCVQSEISKTFAVSNGCSKPILVEIKTSAPELSKSGPSSQVIPPGSTAGFDIILLGEGTQRLRSQVQYIINGKHKFSMDVNAELVPVMLRASRMEVPFKFGPHILSLDMTETVMISNPGNNRADFRVEAHEPFHVKPTQGTVEPYGSEDIQITYRPVGNSLSAEGAVTFSVLGGQDIVVAVAGEVDASKVSCKTKQVDFGSVAAGSVRRKSLSFRNSGANDAVFVSDFNIPGLTLDPPRGVISAGSSAEVAMVFRPQSSDKVDGNIQFNVRGSRPIKVSVLAEVTIPDVKVVQDVLDLGEVMLGGSARTPLTLQNQSPLAADVVVDLSQFAGFSLSAPADAIVEDNEDTMSRPATGADGNIQQVRSNSLASVSSGAPASGRNVVRVPGSGSVEMSLVFTPSEVCDLAFELPIKLVGLPPGPALRRPVCVQALRPLLEVSSSSVDLGRRVVLNEHTRHIKYKSEITICNISQRPASWHAKLVGSGAQEGIFSLDVPEGELAVGEKSPVVVCFQPFAAKTYECRLHIFLNGNLSQPYFDQDVRGLGTLPSLKFDRREAVLPTVPCGVTSSTVFEIINDGFENLELKHVLPAEGQKLNLNVEYPEGNMIGAGRPRLPVRVTMKSSKSLSFVVKLNFADPNSDEGFSIVVCGTVDASILSIFHVIEQFAGDLVLNRPPNAAPTANLPGLPFDFIPPPRNALSEPAALADPAVSVPLLAWANSCLFSSFVSSWPELASQCGRPLAEGIESIVGKSSGAILKRSEAVGKKEAAVALHDAYAKLLSFLRTFGVPCSHVRPELLLTWEDFCRVSSNCGGDTELAQFYEDNWITLHSGAWAGLVLQAARSFVGAKVTTRVVKSMPGVQKQGFDTLGPESALSGSNLYAPSELVLLRWFEYHVGRVFAGDRQKLTDFSESFKDCRVFAAAVLSHVPTMKVLKGLEKGEGEATAAHNAGLLVKALRFLGCDIIPSVEQLIEARPVNTCLFGLYLFQTLPMYIPKAAVPFDGKLSDVSSRQIELTNPAGRPIKYKVCLDGDSEFSCPLQELSIDAKGRVAVPLEYAPNFVRPSEAVVMFVPIKEAGHAVGATLVFSLRGDVKAFKYAASQQLDTRMYEAAYATIPVSNPFNSTCDFTVSIMDDTAANASASTSSRSSRGKKGKGACTSHSLLPAQSFWCKRPQVKLGPGEEAQLNVVFLPFRLTPHRCLVKLSDPNVGEFVLELTGDVQPPAVADTVKGSMENKSSIHKEIGLQVRNAALERARNPLTEVMGADNAKNLLKSLQEVTPLTYWVEYESPFFAGQTECVVAGMRAGSRTGNRGDKDAASDGSNRSKGNDNKLQVELKPKGPGQYKSNVYLKSVLDVRTIEVDLLVNAMGTRASLDISTPARQSVTQEVPIINVSDKDWVVVAHVDGRYFSGPKDIRVPQGGRVNYPLTFSPSWVCNVEGALTMTNNTTGDKYIYTLKGVGEDPLAQDHLNIECRARWKHTQLLEIPNVTDSNVTYQVESDLVGVVGVQTLQVPAGGKANYELGINAPRGGSFSGSVTFKAPDGKYVWYTVEVQAENAPPEGIVDVNAKARQAVIVDVTVKNPLDRAVLLDVDIDGFGLMGDPEISLEAGQEKVYELVFAPLGPADMTGSLTFISEEFGEFWYQLNLVADAADPIPAPLITAPIGSCSFAKVSIDNPTEAALDLSWESTDEQMFFVDVEASGSMLSIAPFESLDVVIGYRPSVMDEKQSGTIILRDQSAGVWEVLAEGIGAEPQPAEALVGNAAVGSTASFAFQFVNPFTEPIVIIPELESDAEKGVFAILAKSKPQNLGPRKLLKFNWIFAPRRMKDHSACIILHGSTPNGELTWRFPLLAQAEASQVGSMGKLVCRARERIEKKIDIELAGSDATPDLPAEIEISAPGETEAIVQKTLAVSLDDSLPAPAPGHLRLLTVFEPLKAFRTSIQLSVNRPNIGRWRFELTLSAQDPEEDDIITIEAPAGKTSSVSFHLQGASDEPEEFRATLSPESPDEFVVLPPKGILPPYGSTGQQFVVHFTPREYGRTYNGKLIVTTENMQWVYVLEGKMPKYTKPTGATKLATHQPSSLMKSLADRPSQNHMASNKAKLKR